MGLACDPCRHVGPGGIKDPSKHPEEVLEAFLAGWPNEVARAEADIVSSAGPSLVTESARALAVTHQEILKDKMRSSC